MAGHSTLPAWFSENHVDQHATSIPNIVNVIRSRNLAAAEISTSTRVVKSPDAASPVPSLHDAEMSIERSSLQVMIGNGWSDPLGNYKSAF